MPLAEVPAGRRQLGRLYFVVVVLLIALFIGVFVTEIAPLRGPVEQARVQYAIGRMQAALAQRMSEIVLHDGTLEALAALAGSNPAALPDAAPEHYVGEREQVDPATLSAGEWAFDRGRGVLVYRVAFPQFFVGDGHDPARAEWRIEVGYHGASRAPEAIASLQLVPLAPFEWGIDAH